MMCNREFKFLNEKTVSITKFRHPRDPLCSEDSCLTIHQGYGVRIFGLMHWAVSKIDWQLGKKYF